MVLFYRVDDYGTFDRYISRNFFAKWVLTHTHTNILLKLIITIPYSIIICKNLSLNIYTNVKYKHIQR